ncbi:MAG: radical SAM protein, partial [Deltaproteobacteria bacterium]|nr:radical SAM protein [Deltaproteobacteria bacterium]
STQECLGVVDDLATLGCEVITLSGGEPTLRDDWATIAEAIAARGMIPNMVTNGLSMSPALARRMKEVGLSNLAVSLDGPPAVHEQIRGHGTFAITERAIRTVQDAGLPVTVMTTVNTLNLPLLEPLHTLCSSLGVARWRLQLGKPMGNLKEHDDWVVKPRELLYLLPRLHRLASDGPLRVGIGDSIGYFGPYDTPLRALSWKGTPQRWGGCQAGLQAIGIEADGGVKGCLSMQAFSDGGADPFCEGSVRRRSLVDIWQDPRSFAYNRCFSEQSLGGFCRSCRHRAECRGGARCMAAAATGRLAEDPYCYHRMAELARQRPLARLRQGAVAVASVSLAGLFAWGCLSDRQEEQRPQPRPGACAQVDCADPELDQARRQQCCETSPPVDCRTVDCGDHATPAVAREECCHLPEYGVEPCAEVDCADPDLLRQLVEQCCAQVEPYPCSGEECSLPEYGVEPDCAAVDCTDPATPPATRAQCCNLAEYGVEPDPCAGVDCNRPGDLPPELTGQCCNVAEYGVEPDPCAGICCDCDYGELPPAECCPPPVDCAAIDCADPANPPEVKEQCCALPDYGVEPDPCANVCCMCEYGELPPGVWEECCSSPPVDCATVDCNDPATPPASLDQCCVQYEYGVEPDPCASVCCDCDYGELPPAECCPPPVDCATVDCSDPATPPAALDQCCVQMDYGDEPDPCAGACCMCEYGDPPPDACCPPPVDCTAVDCGDPATPPAARAQCCAENDYGVEPPFCANVCCEC